MVLRELINMTRLYARDKKSRLFDDEDIILFLNQGIDRMKQFYLFEGIPYLKEPEDELEFVPPQYHYLLALFASSRLFDMDERFFEGTNKRNEFEQLFAELTSSIESGEIFLDYASYEDLPNVADDYVIDEYFGGNNSGGADND